MSAPTSPPSIPAFDLGWAAVANVAEIPSPALLVYPNRVDENLRRMIAQVRDPARLRPHIKTHKLPQLVARQVALGVHKCKCATIAEAEMAARAGASDILVAAQLVGPHVGRFVALQQAFPHVAFATLADNAGVAHHLAAVARGAGQKIEVLVDLDVGQHRTGVIPGLAAELYRTICVLPGLRPGGLHAYDGHLQLPDVALRAAGVEAGLSEVITLRRTLEAEGLPVPRMVCGGTPTFPLHAARPEVECSPGTCVLWDAGYATKLADLDFLHAAVLLTRVISRPTENRLCLDLGHKAVASEMPPPRVVLPEVPDARMVTHSEEHLVVETNRAASFPVGSVLYGLPWHICPTVALHDCVHVVRDGRVDETWSVTARARRLSV